MSDVDILKKDLVTSITEAGSLAIPLSKPTTRQYKGHWYYNVRVAELNHRINITRKNL